MGGGAHRKHIAEGSTSQMEMGLDHVGMANGEGKPTGVAKTRSGAIWEVDGGTGSAG